MTEVVLVCRNARDKVQVVLASLEQDGNVFYINRVTGQYGNKMTPQVRLCVEKGKAKRTVLQQAELEFNSKLNKYLDKGYKRLDSLTNKSFSSLSPKELDELVPMLKSDANGNLKPMLAKPSTQCQNSVFNKPLLCSRKLNGVRCMMKYDEDLDTVITISRGGKNYNGASEKITEELYDFLKSNPEYILDGELYIHGEFLQTISGMARLDSWEERCDSLEYWIYDLAVPHLIFSERFKILTGLQNIFVNNPKVKVIDHYKTESWLEIQTLHDKWVNEGFEGLVARKPDKLYEYGKRSSTMIKVKDFLEDSFEIIDYSEKLREEDFCFILKTKEGVTFEAKPIGTREMKTEYIQNMDNIIGRLGDVRFFEWSAEKKPLQTRFIAVRYDIS